ncbi:P1 family peptidase [Palleronia caenipelagi]|uniref:P1 family peptidase n=1 Tax=Palleronia caenipelagi TaxID=2489174 RepID=A0A547Q5Q8_9RHOB|nr:P1 family peptidase [Palleronia caenipelagi]TRD21722.1 P1 family peptidase [Palleronia caenipelagi]
METGPKNLITDIPGLRVGHAQDLRLNSGVTVLTADAPFVAGVHIMGGAPGTRETDLLAPDKLVGAVDALVLAGGSAFGLSAADGVIAGLRAAGRGFEVAGQHVPIVPAAILFDLASGGEHDWDETPYPALGRAALAAASSEFVLGSVGAGTGAIAGQLKGGIGSASARLPGRAMVGALVAANPVGGTICPKTGRFWAAPFEVDDEFGGLGTPERAEAVTKLPLTSGTSTTIAIVATDLTLDKAAATRLAVAAHDGLARAILPAHTPFDGDLVFAASTGARPAPDPAGLALLGHLAACCLSRAIARAVYTATRTPRDVVAPWSDRYGQVRQK